MSIRLLLEAAFQGMTLRYYGSLKKVVANPCHLQPLAPVSVEELIRTLDIPRSAIKLVMVNHTPDRHVLRL